MKCICVGSHKGPSQILRLHHGNIIVQCYPPSQNPKYTNGWLWGVFRPGATMGLRSHIPSTRLSLPFPHNSYPSDFNPYQHCTMSSTYCLTFSRKWFYWSIKKVRVWTKFKKSHPPPTAQSVSYFEWIYLIIFTIDVLRKQPLQLMHYKRFEMQILSGMLFPFLHPDAVYFASAIILLNRFVLFLLLKPFLGDKHFTP